MRRPGRPLRAAMLLCLAQLAASAGARGAAELVEAGNEALEAGLVPEAISQYESAREKPGGSGVPLFNMGVALVRQENYPAALTAFQSLSEADRKIAPLVHYNQGNVLARLGQMLVSEDPQSAVELYNRSLAAFQRALSLDPGLRPAAYNLEVVRTWIAELLDSGSDEGGSGSQQNGASGNDGNERRNGTPSPGDSPGENPGGSQSPDAAPEQPSDQPPQPELSAPADNPWALRDETAQAILEEERRRREEEASWSGGDSSDGKPNW